jgi:hypothetical protein
MWQRHCLVMNQTQPPEGEPQQNRPADLFTPPTMAASASQPWTTPSTATPPNLGPDPGWGPPPGQRYPEDEFVVARPWWSRGGGVVAVAVTAGVVGVLGGLGLTVAAAQTSSVSQAAPASSSLGQSISPGLPAGGEIDDDGGTGQLGQPPGAPGPLTNLATGTGTTAGTGTSAGTGTTPGSAALTGGGVG